jgi:lipoprotein-anchoring transpeptidase ErfK/SrfK
MNKKLLLFGTAILGAAASHAVSGERYGDLPPVMIDQALTKPWVVQLAGPVEPMVIAPVRLGVSAQPAIANVRRKTKVANGLVEPVAYHPDQPVQTRLDPQYLPQIVEYQTTERPGTIVIDTNNRFLYLVTANGKARRYGVGVGKPGFEWAGAHKVTRKAEWPGWTPPKEMIAREAARGHFLPVHMEGGEANPLGARALYLGSTVYRIHGTNAPWTIGFAVSSGCIRMRNQDVVDLYERVNVGTRVIVQ